MTRLVSHFISVFLEGLRLLLYGDSLTAGAPSMVPFGDALCLSLQSMGAMEELHRFVAGRSNLSAAMIYY